MLKYKIYEMKYWLHSFTTPVLLAVIGIVVGYFVLLFLEFVITEVPIVTLIIIIIYAIYLAKKKKY